MIFQWIAALLHGLYGHKKITIEAELSTVLYGGRGDSRRIQFVFKKQVWMSKKTFIQILTAGEYQVSSGVIVPLFRYDEDARRLIFQDTIDFPNDYPAELLLLHGWICVDPWLIDTIPRDLLSKAYRPLDSYLRK